MPIKVILPYGSDESHIPVNPIGYAPDRASYGNMPPEAPLLPQRSPFILDIDLAGCVNGDEAAWQQFCDQTVRLVVASIRRVCPSGQTPGGLEVEDLIQAVYLKLLRHDYRLLRGFDPSKSSMSTWITLIARSVTIDALRKRNLDARPLNEDIHAPESVHPSQVSAPDIPAGLLTPRQMLVLTLLYEDALEVSDAARVLDVKPQTIRSTKHKAIERLRAHFEARDRGDMNDPTSVEHREHP